MSLISFIKDAGEKLFKKADAAAPAASATTPSAAQPSVGDLNAKAGDAIQRYVEQQNLGIENLDVKYDGAVREGDPQRPGPVIRSRGKGGAVLRQRGERGVRGQPAVGAARRSRAVP